MQGQSNSTPPTLQAPRTIRTQAPIQTPSLTVKTHLKAGMLHLQALMGGQQGGA